MTEKSIYDELKQRVKELEKEAFECRRTEEALRESEKRFRDTAEMLPSVLIEYDLNGVLTYVNPHGYKLADYEPDDFEEGFHVLRLASPEEHQKHYERIEKMMQGEKIPPVEYRLLRKDGSTFWGLVTSSLIRKNKDVVGVRTYTIDISERKEAEEALRESEEKYRSMMEAMHDAAYICSPDLRVEYMNPAMIKRTGHDATGGFCYKAMHNRDTKCSWCVFDKVLQGEHVKYEVVSPKDNRYFHVSNSPIFHTDGSISIFAVFRDVTETKAIERQLWQAQKMESIGTLAAGIAHDFNNILFPIMGFTELALNDIPENSPLQDNINEILIGTKRARDLVKQILTFSRQADKELKPLKVQLVIKEVLQLMRSSLPSTIKINQHISNKCGLVMADVTQIHQIAMNLMANAYQAMEDEGGKLNITLKEVELGADDLKAPSVVPGTYVCLKVSDTGIGMDKSIFNRMFDPYFTTKEVGKSTGLGLAVVHGIVKSYEGDIRVYSEPGKGTAVYVYLPVIKSQIEAEEIDSIGPLQKGTERILLVDDEESIVRMETQMLERLGYQVTARAGSTDALEAFRALPDNFDLVITDMTMPNMTGVQLSQKLLEIRPDIPIIICTGFSNKIDNEKAKAVGIRGYVMKPVVMREMANKIREVLDHFNQSK